MTSSKIPNLSKLDGIQNMRGVSRHNDLRSHTFFTDASGCIVNDFPCVGDERLLRLGMKMRFRLFNKYNEGQRPGFHCTHPVKMEFANLNCQVDQVLDASPLKLSAS